MEAQILLFIEHALADISEVHLKLEIERLPENETQLFQKLTGKDLSGFVRTIDKFAVRHVFKNHGELEKERLRGQIPIEKSDFLLIKITVNQHDLVFSEINKLGNIIFHFEKDFEDFRLIYVEEVRNKRREIALQTLYKQKTRR